MRWILNLEPTHQLPIVTLRLDRCFLRQTSFHNYALYSVTHREIHPSYFFQLFTTLIKVKIKLVPLFETSSMEMSIIFKYTCKLQEVFMYVAYSIPYCVLDYSNADKNLLTHIY